MKGVGKWHSSPRSGRFMVVLVGVMLCTTVAADLAVAQSGPLPGSGYTATYSYGCGVLQPGPPPYCFSQGTRSEANASFHTYGWGSADYDGTNPNSVFVCTNLEIAAYAGSCDYNYARACVYPPQCNDPGDSANWRGRHYVWLGNAPAHTVRGKAKA